MLSLFKKKPVPEKTLTFKTRVEQFWKWYTDVAARFYQTLDSKKAPSLAEEVSAKVDELFPGFAWVFGPGENNQGHSFTLSGEGIIHRQLLAIYWLSCAPKLSGWTFYASRQPGTIQGMSLKIGERTFDPIEFWLTPTVDTDREVISLTVWHPLFDILPERDRWIILFLFLDEALGEYGTQSFLGKIDLSNERLGDSIPLHELLPFIKKAEQEAGWKKYPAGESYTGYSRENPQDRYLRDDIIAGSTANFALIDEYNEAGGELTDPLSGTGADYIFVALDSSILPNGHQTDARVEIEDALDNALKLKRNGQVIGGAHGTRRAYIDLMLFDGQNSLEIVRRVLKEKRLPAGTEVHFFAKEKRGHRIII